MKTEFYNVMKQEAKDAIIEAVQTYTGYGCDFHNEVFNTEYYECYTDRAEKKLEELGVFDCIHFVQEYEKMNFGEVYTDFSDPCKLLNMVWYITGEEVLWDMFANCDLWDDYWNYDFDEDTGVKLIEWAKENERV